MYKTIYLPIAKKITEKEWEKIEIFKRRFKLYWDNFQDLNIGKYTGNFSKGGKYVGKFDIPVSIHRLKGLYVDFRCFYLTNDLANFDKFTSFIAKKVSNSAYDKLIAHAREEWHSKYLRNGFFQFKGKPINTNELIDLWFNGYMFHSDARKYKYLTELLEVFEEETALSLLFDTVLSCGHAIKNLHWSIDELARDNLQVKIPDKFM